MDCPVCRQTMLVVEREEIELDCCAACPGIWFDAGEFDLLAEKHGLPPAELDAERFALAPTRERARLCPRCDRPMEKVWFDRGQEILVDRCEHGIWFDRGELGRALESVFPSDSDVPAVMVSFLGETFRFRGVAPLRRENT